MKRILALLFISAVLVGCMTTSNEKIQNLDPAKGIVLFNVNSKNMRKFELYYQKNTSMLDIEGLLQVNKTVISKDNYDIFLVDAGNYKFSRIEIDGKRHDFPDNEGFTVEAGKIHYIGDISINHKRQTFDDIFEIEVKDEQEQTLASASEELPALADYEVVNSLLIVNKD